MLLQVLTLRPFSSGPWALTVAYYDVILHGAVRSPQLPFVPGLPGRSCRFEVLPWALETSIYLHEAPSFFSSVCMETT